MTFGHPDNGIGVVIDDNGDVAVSLTVAGFINADGSQIFETRRAVRFQKDFGPFNAATYCFPVDAHELTYDAAGQTAGQPGHRQIKVFGEARAMEGPRHGGGYDAVFGAANTVALSLQIDTNAV